MHFTSNIWTLCQKSTAMKEADQINKSFVKLSEIKHTSDQLCFVMGLWATFAIKQCNATWSFNV